MGTCANAENREWILYQTHNCVRNDGKIKSSNECSVVGVELALPCIYRIIKRIEQALPLRNHNINKTQPKMSVLLK
jgi:hypothetical protein